MTALITCSETSPTNETAFQFYIDFTVPVSVGVANAVTCSGGTIDARNTADNQNWTFDVTANGNETCSLSVPAGIYNDSGGSPNTGATFGVVVDTTAPVPIVTANVSSPTSATSWEFYVDFGEAVSFGVASAVTCTNGTLGMPTSGDNINWTFPVTADPNTTVTLNVGAGIYTDGAGNPNIAASLPIVHDNVGPTPIVTCSVGTPTSATNFEFYVNFLQVVSPAVAGMVTCTNGALGTPTSGDNINWTYPVTAVANSMVTLNVPAGVYSDAAGNSSFGASKSILHDDIGPIPVITCLDSSPTNSSPISFQIDFQMPVTPVVASFIIVTNGTIGVPTTGDNIVWSFDVIPVFNTPVQVCYPAGMYADDAGNLNFAAVCQVVVHDNIPPAPIITCSEASPTSANPFDFYVNFGQAVTPADAAGITFSNATSAAPTSSDNITWTYEVYPIATGDVVCSAATGLYQDPAGNDSTAASLTIHFEAPAFNNKDVVLMMDCSGSMGDDVTIETVTRSKLEFTIDAALQFIDEWSAFADSADRYGIVKYGGVAEKLTSALLPFNATNAKGLISGITDGGGTPMGSGLGLSLLDLLDSNTSNDDYGRDRDVILLADGQDNRNPKVTASTSSFSVTAQDSSGYPHTLGDLNVNLGDSDNVPVHTIGIGSSGEWLEKLDNISHVSGGLAYALPPDQIWPLEIDDFEELLTTIYADSSPQRIYKAKSVLHGDQNVESFFLDRGTKRVLICLSWLGDVPLKITVRKNGKKVRHFDRFVRRNDHSYLVADISFPHTEYYTNKPFDDIALQELLEDLQHGVIAPDPLVTDNGLIGDGVTDPSPEDLLTGDIVTGDMYKDLGSHFLTGPGLRKKRYRRLSVTDLWGKKIPSFKFGDVVSDTFLPEGEWEVTIERNSHLNMGPVHYNFSVVGDERFITPWIPRMPPVQYTGHHIPLTIGIREKGGKPVESIYSARVKVTRPRQSVANILSTYSEELPRRSFEKGVSLDEKLSATISDLYKHPVAAKELSEKVVEHVQLGPFSGPNSALGMVNGSVDMLSVPGPYRLEYKVRGVSATAGVFERVMTRCVNVVAWISRRHSEIDRRGSRSGGVMELWVKPKDHFGNLLGPGFADAVNSDLFPKEDLKVVDNLDGTYLVSAKVGNTEKDHKRGIKLRIFGKTFFVGVVADLLAD